MRRLILAAAVLSLAAFSLAPFLWSVVTSVKEPSELFATPPTWVPRSFSLQNYSEIFERRPFARYLANSLLVAALSTAIALAAGSLAAHALARSRSRFAPWIERSILVCALFPPAVLLVPIFSAARAAGLVNSLTALAVVHAALNLPFAVWTLTAFFRRIPSEIEDAARVDGMTRLQILLRIVLPLSGPALAATGILVFIFSWNEFVLALTLLQRDELRTVPVGIALLSGATVYEIPWGQISAAVVLTTLPVVAAVVLFQRWILSGLTAGAVKG